jgi:hypothetical protein
LALIVGIVPVGFETAEKALAGIAKGYPKAAADAINRGLVTGRKVAVMSIRTKYNIKSGDLKSEGFIIKKASWGNLNGSLDAKGPMLPTDLFSPKVKFKRTTKRGPRRQFVTVMIKRGSRKLVKGAFSDHYGRVLERRQPEKYPIFPVSTIGVPFMVGSMEISDKVQEAIASAIGTNLARNVDAMLSGAWRGSGKGISKATAAVGVKVAS